MSAEREWMQRTNRARMKGEEWREEGILRRSGDRGLHGGEEF